MQVWRYLLDFSSDFWYSIKMMIQVYAVNTAGQDFMDEQWSRYLSEERKKAAANIRQNGQRQLFLGAEALLNRSLEAEGVPVKLPAAYIRNRYGKPFLTALKGLYVNWSHSGTCAVCALSDREVGVDLQDTGREPGEALIHRVLQQEERTFYEQMPAAQRKKLFYEYWVIKESYLKALGTGFYTPLDQFYVRMNGIYPEVVPKGKLPLYTCRLLNAGEGYTAAVCVEGVHPKMGAQIPVKYIC